MNITIHLFNLFLVAVSALFILGCASGSKVPSEKSAEAKSFEATANKGTVYLYRTGRDVGAAGQLNVKAGQVYLLRQDARLGVSSGRVAIQWISSW